MFDFIAPFQRYLLDSVKSSSENSCTGVFFPSYYQIHFVKIIDMYLKILVELVPFLEQYRRRIDHKGCVMLHLSFHSNIFHEKLSSSYKAMQVTLNKTKTTLK